MSIQTHIHLWYPVNDEAENNNILPDFRQPELRSQKSILSLSQIGSGSTIYFSRIHLSLCPFMRRFWAGIVVFNDKKQYKTW